MEGENPDQREIVGKWNALQPTQGLYIGVISPFQDSWCRMISF